MSAFQTPYNPSGSFSYYSITNTTPAPRRTAEIGTSDSINNPQYLTSTLRRKKRQKSANENDILPALDINSPSVRPYKKRKSSRTTVEKIQCVLDAISDANWTLGDFLFHVFQDVDDSNTPVHRDPAHAAMVHKFLGGHTVHYPAEILKFWWHHRDGRLDRHSESMFSTSPYIDIKPIRPALSSFAIQLTKARLVKEASAATQRSAGLHTSRGISAARATWVDIGATTVPTVSDILKDRQPAAWYLITEMASSKARKRGGVIAVRKNRPVEVVATHVLSSILFARNQNARLLPSAKGILYFALSAPAELFTYESRIGNVPAYGTVYKILKHLGDEKAIVTRGIGQDVSKWGVIVMDNVQQYVRRRDHRFGNENAMSIGIAATLFEMEGYPQHAPDLANKQARIAEGKRKELDIDMLLGWTDNSHLETIGILHWLRTLTDFVPELGIYKAHVSLLFRTRAAKYRIPAKPAKVHPLATSGKNETVTVELKDALLDFLAQIGLTREQLEQERLILAGGDGLTYEKLLLLKKYLQTHNHPFENLSTIQPVLQAWHTEATNLSRVFETHWGKPLSNDPSTLGHSATKIGRSPPPNLKKVDYYPGIQLLFLVYDVRQLDCWRLAFKTDNIFNHFASLAASEKLPNFEDLEEMARTLYRSYTSSRAQYRALYNIRTSDDIIPMGSEWIAPTIENSAGVSVPKKKRTKKSKESSPLPPAGDRVLANSINFMRDAMICRECTYAIADGDAGRLYECLKVMIFTFAGSTHMKYCTYLLEFIVDLELESSEDLKNGVLHSLLINLSGKEGSFAAGDIIQEFHNRCLEAIMERKGAEFSGPFIRDTVSRNIEEMCRIKKDLLKGIAIEARSGRHSEPHERPEVKTLLENFSLTELHSFRAGRTIDSDDRDDFARGLEKLRNGRLQKWVTETTGSRDSAPLDAAELTSNERLDDDGIFELGHDIDTVDSAVIPQSLDTFGLISLDDGEFQIDIIDPDEIVDVFTNMIDEERPQDELSEDGNDSDTMSVAD